MAAHPAVTPEVRAEIVGEALERILHGATLKEIATEHGIDTRTLNRWLLGDVPEKYRAIQAQGLILRIVEADEALAAARDHVEISRCREICKFVRWDAERRLSRLFGLKTEVSATITETVSLPEAARRLAFILNNQNAQDATIINPQTTTEA